MSTARRCSHFSRPGYSFRSGYRTGKAWCWILEDKNRADQDLGREHVHCPARKANCSLPIAIPYRLGNQEALQFDYAAPHKIRNLLHPEVQEVRFLLEDLVYQDLPADRVVQLCLDLPCHLQRNVDDKWYSVESFISLFVARWELLNADLLAEDVLSWISMAGRVSYAVSFESKLRHSSGIRLLILPSSCYELSCKLVTRTWR